MKIMKMMFYIQKYFSWKYENPGFAGNPKKFLDLAKNINIPKGILMVSEAGAPKVRFSAFPLEKCDLQEFS